MRMRSGVGRREGREPCVTPRARSPRRAPRALQARRQDGHVHAHRSRAGAARERVAPSGRTDSLSTTLPVARSSRELLVRRAKQLAWLGVGGHAVEAAIAIGAGVAAGSIALVGFGADSLIESAAGFVVLWLFTGARRGSPAADRRAQRLVGLSFYALAVYVAVEAVRNLATGHHPETS